MNKLTAVLLSGVLMFGAAACADNEKTAQSSSDSTNPSEVKAPEAQEVQNTQNDATSDVRKAQIESDIRAREQRNNVTGDDLDRAEADLENEVRGKLEANIPKGQLTIDSKEGVVTVAGTVQNQQDLAKIAPLAKEIKGVKSVNVKATVAKAAPAANQ